MSTNGEWSRDRWQYRLRRLLPADLPAVIRLWCAQRPLPPALEERLADILHSLVRDQFMLGTVAERLRGPGQAWEVAAFGLGCFMADALRQRYLERPFSFLSVHVLEQVACGRIHDVLLSRREVVSRQKSSSPQLDYYVPCWLQDNYDYADIDARRTLLQGLRVMERYIAGHRLRSLLVEGSMLNRPAFELAGFGELIDCNRHIPQQYLPLLQDSRYHPQLHGLHTLEHASRELPITPVTQLFLFSEPVLNLTDKQKMVLDLAVEGYSDRAIAEALGTSSNAVHMRWRGIYEKAALILPELSLAEENCEKGCRGMEKRRIVVQYVREHPEEIRPSLLTPWQASPRRQDALS